MLLNGFINESLLKVKPYLLPFIPLDNIESITRLQNGIYAGTFLAMKG